MFPPADQFIGAHETVAEVVCRSVISLVVFENTAALSSLIPLIVKLASPSDLPFEVKIIFASRIVVFLGIFRFRKRSPTVCARPLSVSKPISRSLSIVSTSILNCSASSPLNPVCAVSLALTQPVAPTPNL